MGDFSVGAGRWAWSFRLCGPAQPASSSLQPVLSSRAGEGCLEGESSQLAFSFYGLRPGYSLLYFSWNLMFIILSWGILFLLLHHLLFKFAVLEFELRSLTLLGKSFATWARLPSPLLLVCFWDRVLGFLPRQTLNHSSYLYLWAAMPPNLFCFFFFSFLFFAVLGFEVRASCLLGRLYHFSHSALFF
jgi:hypothetical protein